LEGIQEQWLDILDRSADFADEKMKNSF